MRAYRPSRLSSRDELVPDLELELAKEANVRLYSERAQAGMPLFEGFNLARRQEDGGANMSHSQF